MVRPAVQEEVDFIILQGGEMPEVTYYESLGQLSREGIEPDQDEAEGLLRAVLQRYQTIIRRDLNPDNIPKVFFRSPQRALINWKRMAAFAQNNRLELDPFRKEAGGLLLNYLKRERDAVAAGRDFNTFGLEPEEIRLFFQELGVPPERYQGELTAVAAVETLDYRASALALRRALRRKN